MYDIVLNETEVLWIIHICVAGQAGESNSIFPFEIVKSRKVPLFAMWSTKQD